MLLSVPALAQAEARPITQSIGRVPYAVLISGQFADTLSTLKFLSEGRHESNALIGDSRGKLLAMKVGGTVSMLLMMKLLDKIAKDRNSAAAK